jgi:hypothetical protein
VTVLSTTEERPSLARAVVARALAVAAFATAVGAAWAAAARPTVGIAVGFAVSTSVAFGRTPRPGPVKRQVLEMLLGLYFLASVIASAGDGSSAEAGFGAFAAALAGIWASRRMVRALRPTPAPAVTGPAAAGPGASGARG